MLSIGLFLLEIAVVMCDNGDTLDKCRSLKTFLTQPGSAKAVEAFRERVTQAVTSYNVASDDVQIMLKDSAAQVRLAIVQRPVHKTS